VRFIGLSYAVREGYSPKEFIHYLSVHGFDSSSSVGAGYLAARMEELLGEFSVIG
jgi:hypothetical protein